LNIRVTNGYVDSRRYLQVSLARSYRRATGMKHIYIFTDLKMA